MKLFCVYQNSTEDAYCKKPLLIIFIFKLDIIMILIYCIFNDKIIYQLSKYLPFSQVPVEGFQL